MARRSVHTRVDARLGRTKSATSGRLSSATGGLMASSGRFCRGVEAPRLGPPGVVHDGRSSMRGETNPVTLKARLVEHADRFRPKPTRWCSSTTQWSPA